MPLKRRTRVPRRGRRSSFRKRRLARRRRLVKRFKKRKTTSRRTKLTQGFPRTTVTTLKYVDNVTDLTPQSCVPDAGKNAPGILAFSCNDPGQPDLGTVDRTDFPTQFAIQGSFPHQPLGYDQYTLLYQNAKVLRSTAKFTLCFATRDGFSTDVPVPASSFDQHQTDTVELGETNIAMAPGTTTDGSSVAKYPVVKATPLGVLRFPAGMYVGIIRVNSFNPLALPMRYSEFLERFKAPLKFVPYRREQGGFSPVTLYGMYSAPSSRYLRSQVSRDVLNSDGERIADMLTSKNGDIPWPPSAPTFIGRSGCRHRPPAAQFAWQVVCYYPDKTGIYVLPTQDHEKGFIDAFALRATVNIRYRIRFSKLRQLKQSFLMSTPGVNEQHTGGGVPASGGGSAPVTTTNGIIDQVYGQYPNTQKGLGIDEHREVASAY